MKKFSKRYFRSNLFMTGKVLNVFCVIPVFFCFCLLSSSCSQDALPDSPTILPALSENFSRERKNVMLKGGDWLQGEQRENGAFGQFQADIGITALAVKALYRLDALRYRNSIEKAVKLILSKQAKEGKNKGAFVGADGKFLNYRTCVSMMLLYELDKEKYRDEILAAQHFIKGLQFLDASQKRDYGAIGYGSKIRGDLSNTQFALEALAKTGVNPSDPVFKRAKLYLSRLQNYRDGSDLSGFDGGFSYGISEAGSGKSPAWKDEEGNLHHASYGSMTYAGLKSMIYARMERRHPQVQAAFNWIRQHYTLEENPGLAPLAEPAKAQQGLYYYNHTFAKALNLLGIDKIRCSDGKEVSWREDLIEALAKRQDPEGFWRNEHSRWWEADRQLVTAYALLALSEVR
jgi:squalene-hopene/tetraprenyl-beta-curcumene cyclase